MENENVNELLHILREEYGITTMQELNEAIQKMSKLDLFPFCGTIDDRRQENI